jgi:hypothetical protein
VTARARLAREAHGARALHAAADSGDEARAFAAASEAWARIEATLYAHVERVLAVAAPFPRTPALALLSAQLTQARTALGGDGSTAAHGATAGHDCAARSDSHREARPDASASDGRALKRAKHE